MHLHGRSTAAALAVLLLLQSAVALTTCERPARAAALAFAMAQMRAHADHDGAQRDADLCFARCGSQDQTAGKAQFNLPDLAAHPGAVMRVALDAPVSLAEYRLTGAAAAGPPPRIRFQSFLL